MTDTWSINDVPGARPARPPAPQPSSWTVEDVGGTRHGYQSDQEFGAAMARTLGPGHWRDTGDYRSQQRENDLRQQGAGTVAPGATSNHSRGTPSAPGAHDFVPVGETTEQALARVRAMPGVRDAFYEGAHGTQGGHIHVDMTEGDDWTHLMSGGRSQPAEPTRPQSAAPPDLRGGGQAGVPARPDSTFEQVDRAAGDVARGIGGFMAAPIRDLGAHVQQQYQEDQQRFNEPTNNPLDFARHTADSAKAALNWAGIGAEAASDVALGPLSAVTHAEDQALQTPIPGLDTAHRAGTVAGGQPDPGASVASIVSPALWAIAPEAGPAAEASAARDATSLRTRTLPQQGAEAPRPRPVRQPEALEVPRQRSLAASTNDQPPRTDIVGDETNPATRTANALYRLNGSNIGDRIELQQFRKALPPEVRDPAAKEQLYHALEQKLVDPNAEIPPELKPAYEAIQPYLKEQTDIINRLREHNDPTLDPFIEDQGYVHRIREDQPDILNTSDQGGPRSPFQSRKSLVKTASAQRARKFIALEDEQGNRIFPKGQDEGKNPYSDLRPGMEFRPAGQAPEGAANPTFKVVQPTTAEIEANTNVRFKKDAIDNTLANVMQLRRVERNLDVLEQTLDDMKERGVAHREEWNYRDPETGNLTVARANSPTPEGFRSLPDVPQLKGWVFDHNDAQVQELKDWLPKHDESWVDRLDRVNNFLLRSNFLSPFVHPKNIAEFWGTARGWDWFHPEGYGRLAKTLPTAMREVMTMGPRYQQMLREGSALLSADGRTQQFNEMLTNTAGKQLIEDPSSFAALKKAFGDIVGTPAKLYQKFQEASHNMMWSLGDTMMMQRVLELQEKGMPIRDAIRKAEEVIPNYRVPAQIMDSPTGGRMLHHLFSNNRFFSIGRYHYNRLAAWGRMFRKVVKGTPEERKEALGQFLAMATIGALVLPAIDKGLQLATGNKNATVKRGGILALPDAASKVASGQEDIAQAIAQVIDLSPEAELTTQSVRQQDYFGDPVSSRFKSPAANIAGELNLPLSQFGPLSGIENALRPGYGPERAAGNMFGVDLPQHAPGAVKGSTDRRLRKQNQRRDASDPLVRVLQSLGVP